MTHVLIDVDLDPVHLKRLRSIPGVVIHESPTPRDYYKARPLPAEVLRGKRVLLCKYPPENFEDVVDLDWMQLCTAGFEHLAKFKLYDSKIRVTNARGVFDTAIGEWNLAMMINLVRDMPGMFRNQQTKTWSRDMPYHQEIRQKTVGLWGYGGIGRETARLAKAFGMTVHALTRHGVQSRANDYTDPGTGDPEGVLPDRIFRTEQWEEFLKDLDFLVLCLPHTSKTTGLIGERELQAMKPGSFLLNVARGPIVQEAALLSALRHGPIAGAALDVHFAYPLPTEHPLWTMPNVILTPHISGSEKSVNFKPRMVELFYQNLMRYQRGEPLVNLLSAAEWRETCGV